jgi:phosphotransferase system enzyme I (PtsI)
MGEHPVVIRTMDLGGDKLSREHSEYHENNPFLGWRSIRFCLARPELFQIQLRALLRASVSKNLRIMLPMISGVEELLQARKIINQVKRELTKEKIPFNEAIKIGIMVEVPSAVMVLDALAGYSDFFSIGTNDLIQYTIAVDRGNERVSYLYNGLHPAVLRLIKTTIDCGKRHSRPVEMCGEMAGNPFNTVLLVGMGLRCFSMSASFIPEVKKVIRSISTVEAEALARKALSLNQIDQIEKLIKDFLVQRLPEMADRFMS